MIEIMKKLTKNEFTYSLPALRGVQAGREYYVTMCPLQYIPQIFSAAEGDLPPELHAQRTLNQSRVPIMTRYIVENQSSYIFSSLTASIDGNVTFEPSGSDAISTRLGTLLLPMDAKILINDGQHRRAAIVRALEECPELKHETISIVFFVDSGLKNSQQMFADLNRYAIRPTKSLGILYDHRDPMARLASELAEEVPVFHGMTEKAKTTISNRSRKLFTLSSIYQATKRLLSKKEGEEISKSEKDFAIEFWTTVGDSMPDWKDAVDRKVSTSELRTDYIHSHGLALHAIAIAGATLVVTEPKKWQERLTKLSSIDWTRSNAKLWEGRATIGGRLSKAQNNLILTANILKKHLSIELEPAEEIVEEKYKEGDL
jgi:DNA sulfur modification protein DndB